MRARARRVLLVSHECTLTGAPMNLLHFARWLREHTDVELHVVVLRDGPLRFEFAQLCEVTVLDGEPLLDALAAVEEGLVHLGSRRAWRVLNAARLSPRLRGLRGFDIVYLNSATSVAILPHLPPARLVVNHVHELRVALGLWEGLPGYDLFRTRPDRWIAASGAVRDVLVNDLSLPADRVLLHHEFIDAERFATASVPQRVVERCRRDLGIPVDAAVVVGAGTIDWRKGPDLFVQLAAEVRRRCREPVRFVWVGGDLEGPDMIRLRSDIDRTAARHVHFVGVKPDPLPWFAMADVFALTSREDPFPLVALEHAAMGHPIVTYRNGGMPELLEAAGPDAARGVVDHLDVGMMADRIIELIGSTQLSTAAGGQLQARVLAHHDVSTAAPRLYQDLIAALDGAPLQAPSRRNTSG